MSTTLLDWEERYRTGQTGWQRAVANPTCLAWIADGTLPRGRILVPGAGRSEEPLALAKAGYVVTVVDIAASAVEFQAGRLAGFGGVALQADLFAYAPAVPFDAAFEQTCLCALPPELWERYAACLAGWIRPGGVLGAMFIQTGREGGPPFHCDLGRMRGLFSAAAWAWPADPQPVPQFGGMAEIPAPLRRLGKAVPS
jgi:hypothetical protein